MDTCPKRSASVAFRVTIHDSAAEFRLEAEGPVTAAGAAEIEQRWRTAASTIGGRRFALDLSGASFVEPDAGAAIERLREAGATVAGRLPAARNGVRRMSVAELLECMAYRLGHWARAGVR